MTSILRRAITRLQDAIFSGPGIFALALGLYVASLAPGVYAFDSAELATGAYALGIIHPTGYPIYLLLGKLFTFLPVGDVAYRLNLMSAFFAALTISLVYLLLREMIRSREIAWISAALLGVSSHFWQSAVIAEVYSLHTAFMAACILMLLKWRRARQWKHLATFAFLYGLSLTNHTSGVLFLPGYALLAFTIRGFRLRDHWLKLLGLSALFVLALTPYLYLPIRALGNPEINYLDNYSSVDLTTLSGFLWMISGRAYRFFAFGYSWVEVPGEAIRFVSLLWRNFLGAGVVLGILGVPVLWKHLRKVCAGLLLIFIPYTLFFINYRVVDKETMFLPAFVIWAIFAAGGLQAALRWVATSFDQANTRRTMEMSLMILSFSLLLPAVLLNWRWLNMSETRGPQNFAHEVIETAAPNAIVLADWSPAVILEYFQVVGEQRPDLTIVNRSRSRVARYYDLWEMGMQHESILALIEEEEIRMLPGLAEGRPIHIIGYDPIFAGEYEYLPEGSYFSLVPADSES